MYPQQLHLCSLELHCTRKPQLLVPGQGLRSILFRNSQHAAGAAVRAAKLWGFPSSYVTFGSACLCIRLPQWTTVCLTEDIIRTVSRVSLRKTTAVKHVSVITAVYFTSQLGTHQITWTHCFSCTRLVYICWYNIFD